MKVIVFGASGKTGRLVVDKAVAAGHEVTAFQHGDEGAPAGVHTVRGDAADADAERRAVAGHDAVIDTIGGVTPYKDTGLEASTARAIIAGMKTEGVRRLVVISALGVGDSAEQGSWWYRHMMMPTMLRGAVADKTLMEAEVDASGLDFTLVRPAILSDDPETGAYKVVSAPDKAHHTRRGDLAAFLVDQITSDRYVGQAVTVANN